jgi:hypothetical protein
MRVESESGSPKYDLSIYTSSFQQQRQLNLGGSCPGGFVCCRNPVRPQQNSHQNNKYPATPIQQSFNHNNNGFQNLGNSGNNNNGFQNLGNSGNSNGFQNLGNSGNNNGFQNLGNSGNGGFGQQQPSLNQLSNNIGFAQGIGQCGKRNARGITGRVTNANVGMGFTDGDTDYGMEYNIQLYSSKSYDPQHIIDVERQIISVLITGEYPWQVAILKKDGYDNVYAVSVKIGI